MKLKRSTYRYIAILIYVSAVIPSALNNMSGYMASFIIMILATCISFQYKCPSSRKVFDLRVSKRKLTYCPGCGEWVDWS